MKKPPIKNAVSVDGAPLFVSIAGPDDGLSAVHATAGTMKRNEPIFRTKASGIYRNIDTNISVRDGMTRSDYDVFRPEEATPTESKKIVAACMGAYKKVGLVRNVVELMADFATEGVKIVHPNKGWQEFLNNWAKTVDFADRSERFLNLLYRTGTVVIKKVHAKLRQKDVERLQRGTAALGETVLPDVEVEPPLRIPKNQIPYGYKFTSVLNIEVEGGEDLAAFTGEVKYAMRISGSIISKIKNAKTPAQREMLRAIPDYIINAVRSGKQTVPLDSQKLEVCTYKKDDWEMWGEPIAAAALEDLTMLNKLKLADMAALDGAISHIRLWKLGSLEHKIYPTSEAISMLSDMLASSVGGGAVDIIWGPDLEIEETSTDIYKFLGSEKYKTTLISLYDTFGIPIALTGYASQGSLSNNSLSLKTMIRRLEYGRRVLREFWERELADIQRAFGFKIAPRVVFSRMTLSDESAEKALLIQLADRNLISIETLQERFGEIPEIEMLRQRREDRERKSGKRLRQSSQWHNPEHQEALEKIALQTGIATPSEIGLELKERKQGETPALEAQLRSQEAQKAMRGVPGQGRPLNKKDSKKRKTKSGTTQTGRSIANYVMWARSAQEDISKIVNPLYLEYTNKKKITALSDEQSHTLEKLKFSLLCNFNLYDEIQQESVAALLAREEPLTIPAQVEELCNTTIGKFVSKTERQPTIDEIRNIQATAYACYIGEI